MIAVLVLSTLLCAALITCEHLLLARPLAQFENARRAIGVVTVLACAAAPVAFDVLTTALQSFGYTCALFAVSGGVMFAADVTEQAIAHQRSVERERHGITAARD